MRRPVTQVLMVLGFCLLWFAGPSLAQLSPSTRPRVSAPEIDAGSVAGVLAIVAGSLALLRERLRRQ
jgi:NO-binding membrane sensor protein with MHYT domain